MLRGRHGVALLVGALVLGLAGCATPAPAVTANSASANPSSARPDVVQSAISRYREYSLLDDEALQGSKQALEGLKQYMSATDWRDEASAIQKFYSSGHQFKGLSRLVSYKVQKVERSGGSVTFYACEDLSSTSTVVKDTKAAAPSTGPARITFLVEASGLPGLPVVMKSTQWPGASVC